MPPTVRTVSCTVVFDGNTLTDVISARGQVSADGGWPTCSVFCTDKPASGGEDDTLVVTAGAGNNVVRFTGPVRRFRPSGFPKATELVAMGTLAYAAEWSPSEDIRFILEFPSGATDEDLVVDALNRVVRLGGGFDPLDIAGTGVTLGTVAPEAFDWKAGTTAWQRIQEIDRATLYRTYQQRDGTITRVRMIGHPNTTEDFTLAPADAITATGSRDTERTRNAVIVRGHDYGQGTGPVVGLAYGDWNGLVGSDPDERFPEEFSSDLIEDGNDSLGGAALGLPGLDAQDIADDLLNDVFKEFVEAEIQSWRDDTHGPGLTALVDMLVRLEIGEPMWLKRYGWEVGENGWTSTYGLTGGGVEQTYTPPDV